MRDKPPEFEAAEDEMHGLSDAMAIAPKSIAIANSRRWSRLAAPGGAGAQDGDAGGALELIDPHVFRACADPRNLPFSNEAGEGFENKIAELFARKLGKSVAYTFYPDATGFIRNTLNAHRCDVVLGIAQGDDIVQPTSPYYRTSYVAAYREDGPLKGLESLSDPRLKTAKIGVVAGTPPASFLAADGLLGQIKSYALVVDTRFDSPTHEMMDDLDRGEIDIALLWGPIAGYYAMKAKTPTAVVPAPERAGRSPYGLSNRDGGATFRSELEARPQQADFRESGRNPNHIALLWRSLARRERPADLALMGCRES